LILDLGWGELRNGREKKGGRRVCFPLVKKEHALEVAHKQRGRTEGRLRRGFIARGVKHRKGGARRVRVPGTPSSENLERDGP